METSPTSSTLLIIRFTIVFSSPFFIFKFHQYFHNLLLLVMLTMIFHIMFIEREISELPSDSSLSFNFVLFRAERKDEGEYICQVQMQLTSNLYFLNQDKRCKKTFQMSSPPKALRATKVMVTKPVKKRSKSSSGLVRARSRLELISSG